MRRVDVFLNVLNCNEIGCEIPPGMPEVSQINSYTFTFITGKVSTGTLNCINTTVSRSEITLPSSGFVRVPETCSFFTKEFKIHKLFERGKYFYHAPDVDFSVQSIEVHTKDETEVKLLRKLDFAERMIRDDFAKEQREAESKLSSQMKLTEDIDERLDVAIISGGSFAGLLVIVLTGLFTMYCALKKSIDYYHKD